MAAAPLESFERKRPNNPARGSSDGVGAVGVAGVVGVDFLKKSNIGTLA